LLDRFLISIFLISEQLIQHMLADPDIEEFRF